MQSDNPKPDLDDGEDNAFKVQIKRSAKSDAKADSGDNKKTSKSDAEKQAGTAPELADPPSPKKSQSIKVTDASGDEQPSPDDAVVDELLKPEPTEPVPKPDDVPTEEEKPDDPDTSEAVDDIVAHESDELLRTEDEELSKAFKPPEKRTLKQKIAHFFAAWWHNRKARYAAIVVSLLLIATTALVPHSRYFVLNTVGIRSSLSVKILDESTFQPLKNVQVSVHGVSALTDGEGQVNLHKIKLGSTELKIEKRAFATETQRITIGWGSNPQHDVSLKPVGAQYAFVVTDFLSGKGVSKIEAVSGEASAISDDQGKIRLTIDEPADEFQVQLTGKDYREEVLTVNVNSKDEIALQLAPARKHVFVSKRSGKFDVYKIDADGKNEQMILPGTGSERDDMVLIVHPAEEIAALVSTRNSKRNRDGYLLSTLTLIDLKDNTTAEVATSERIQLVDWIGNRIVYVQVAAGASAANPQRHRLMSYEYKDNDNKELAASNYFNDVMAAAGKIYYAPSSAYQNGSNVSMFKIDADGSNRQVVLGKETWNMFRTGYDTIAASVPGEWYNYKLGDVQATKLGGEPANLTSRVYVDNHDGKKSLWVDIRDGKGVLIAYDVGSKEEKVLRTQSGLKNPLRWLDDHTTVFRIHTDQETADYALSLDGGEPKKIRDVTNIGGVDQWYYY